MRRLNQIRTRVYALNFADDEFYQDSLHVFDRVHIEQSALYD